MKTTIHEESSYDRKLTRGRRLYAATTIVLRTELPDCVYEIRLEPEDVREVDIDRGHYLTFRGIQYFSSARAPETIQAEWSRVVRVLREDELEGRNDVARKSREAEALRLRKTIVTRPRVV